MATTASVSKSIKPTPRRAKKARFVSLDGRITVEDWAKLPETKPHYELIDGVLKQKPVKTFAQAHTAGRLAIEIHTQLENRGWQAFTAGTGFNVGQWNGFVPDVTLFSPETVLDPDALYQSSAFLVGEIAAPSIPKSLQNKKRRGYELAGVKFSLFIDPAQRIFEVYRLENEKYGAPETLQDAEIWRPAELPGLALEIAKLWM